MQSRDTHWLPGAETLWGPQCFHEEARSSHSSGVEHGARHSLAQWLVASAAAAFITGSGAASPYLSLAPQGEEEEEGTSHWGHAAAVFGSVCTHDMGTLCNIVRMMSGHHIGLLQRFWEVGTSESQPQVMSHSSQKAEASWVGGSGPSLRSPRSGKEVRPAQKKKSWPNEVACPPAKLSRQGKTCLRSRLCQACTCSLWWRWCICSQWQEHHQVLGNQAMPSPSNSSSSAPSSWCPPWIPLLCSFPCYERKELRIMFPQLG